MKECFAFVFPGQGSQSLGMMNHLKDSAIVLETFKEASLALGFDLWTLVEQGPEEKLNQTEYTQPALLTAGVAIYRHWKHSQQPSQQTLQSTQPSLTAPKVMAGHSLGEYSALVCAESLSLKAAVTLVSMRGRLMQNAVAEGEGAMAAILGLSDADVFAVCDEATKTLQVSPANFNAPGQVVISGHRAAVLSAMELAKLKGAKRAILLPVSVPSHCILMKSAAEAFSETLKTVSFQAPKIPVLHNVDLAFHADPDNIRNALSAQLYRPVRWVESIQKLEALGVKTIYETGPGSVLTGLNKRIAKDLSSQTLQFGEAPCLV